MDREKEVYTRPVLTRHQALKDITAGSDTGGLGCTRL
jgi:hypothetical protein